MSNVIRLRRWFDRHVKLPIFSSSVLQLLQTSRPSLLRADVAWKFWNRRFANIVFRLFHVHWLCDFNLHVVFRRLLFRHSAKNYPFSFASVRSFQLYVPRVDNWSTMSYRSHSKSNYTMLSAILSVTKYDDIHPSSSTDKQLLLPMTLYY